MHYTDLISPMSFQQASVLIRLIFLSYITCCPLKFLHALENDQLGFLAHIPANTGVLPTIFNNKHSKIGPKFSVCAPITLGLKGVSNRTKFFHVTCMPRGRHDNLGTNFGRLASLEFWRAKT